MGFTRSTIEQLKSIIDIFRRIPEIIIKVGGDPGGGESSYDFRVQSVVENQPFSLVGLTIIKPV